MSGVSRPSSLEMTATEKEPGARSERGRINSAVSTSPARPSTAALVRGQSRALLSQSFFQPKAGKWKQPDATRAQRLSQKEVYHEGSGSILESSENFSSLSISIPLYFRFLKLTGASLGLFFLFNIPTLLLAMSGTNMSNDSLMSLAKTTFGNIGRSEDVTCSADSEAVQSLAQHAVVTGVNVSQQLAHCATADRPINLIGLDIALTSACYLVTACDFMGTVFLIVLSIWFRKFLFDLKNKVDREHLTASNYAVLVTRLPPDATKESIRIHFSDLYDPNKSESYQFPGYLKCFCRRIRNWDHPPVPLENRLPPVDNRDLNTRECKEPGNYFYANYEDGYVAEVSMAYSGNGDLIRHFMTCDGLYLKILRCKAKVQKFSGEENEILDLDLNLTGDPKAQAKAARQHEKIKNLLEKAKDELKNLQAKLQKMRSNLHKKRNIMDVAAQAGGMNKTGEGLKGTGQPQQAVCAFVIFNHRESYLRCVEDYKMSRTSCYRRCLPRPLRFLDEYNIEVQRAPQPGSIIWENLDTSPGERFARRCSSLGFTMLLLLLSAMIYSVGTAFKKTTLPDLQCVNTDFCNVDLPSAYYGAYRDTDTVIFRDEGRDKYCPGDKVYISMLDLNSSAVDYNSTACTSPCKDPYKAPGLAVDEKEVVRKQCATAACDPKVTNAPSKCQYYDDSCIVVCFCKHKLTELSDTEGVDKALKTMKEDPHLSSLCSAVVEGITLGQTYTFAAVLIVVAFNWVLQRVLHSLAEFEHHEHTGAENASKLVKVFVARFINTALVMLVVSSDGVPIGGWGSRYRVSHTDSEASWNNAVYDVMKTFRVFNGNHKDLTKDWYAGVATGLLFAMIITIFQPLLVTVCKFLIMEIKKCLCAKNRLVQHDLDEVYKRPTIDLEKRYAQLLTVVFVALFYSAGLPLMPLFGCLCFFACFWFDKWMVVHGYAMHHNAIAGLDGSLALLASRILPWATVMHLMMAIWLYGQDEIAYSTSFPPSSGTVLSLTGGNNTVYRAWMGFIQMAGAVDPFEWTYCNEASINITDGVVTCGHADGIIPGILRRVVRANVFPIFVLLALVILGLLLRLIGAPLYKLLKQMCFCISRKRNKVGDIMPELKYPGYTSTFVLDVHSSEVEATMARLSHTNKGWDKTKSPDRQGYVRLRKKWRYKGLDESGHPHEMGEFKKTWQVIAETTGWSYNMFKIEKYRIAMMSSVGEFLHHSRGQRTKGLHSRTDSKARRQSYVHNLREEDSHWQYKHVWDERHLRSVVRKVRGDWQQLVDVQTKEPYYYNMVTDESQWDPPMGGDFDEYEDEESDTTITKVHIMRKTSSRYLGESWRSSRSLSLSSTGSNRSRRNLSLSSVGSNRSRRNLSISSTGSATSAYTPMTPLSESDDGSLEDTYLTDIEEYEAPNDPEDDEYEDDLLESSVVASDWAEQHEDSVPVAVHGKWQKFYDFKSKSHYYYHKMLGMSQWEEPHDWWTMGDVHRDFNDWTPVVDDEHNVLFYYNINTGAAQNQPPHSSLDVTVCHRRHMLVNESNDDNLDMWDRLCDSSKLVNESGEWETYHHAETDRTFFRHNIDNFYQWASPDEECDENCI